jgi:cytochrome c-type biogenesis protein CcmH
MILWIILTLMSVAAAVGLTIPLVRRYDAKHGNARVGRAAPVEADAPGAEVASANRGENAAPARRRGERAMLILALGLAATVAPAATIFYFKYGRPDLSGAAPAAAIGADTAHPGGGDIAGMIAQLEAKMKQSPGDPEGWRMLGWSYMQTGRYADAANAYGRASALDPANGEYLSAQGEALTQAAGGQVTPGAREVFRIALAKDAGDPRARYFLAMARDQDGDHPGAMADWIALLKSAPPDAPWTADVRAFVQRAAKARGEDLAATLPPATPGPGAGPDAAQVAAAQGMDPADQQAMITGMVDYLAARLKTNPRDSDGWVKLMRARMVLGQTDAAAGALHAALAAYAGTPEQQAALRVAARGLGVPGA